jgi:hypothetical protein
MSAQKLSKQALVNEKSAEKACIHLLHNYNAHLVTSRYLPTCLENLL